ncbi:MAG: hypothetical protein E6K46_13180 [Gammaproteobacteria bacterium]|nr:MAG: hypothetical protein E6K46_13180 [Gammaproteobacteria bacterium]
MIDNQNIFNLEDPKDDVKLFRLANHLHGRTRKSIIREQLLFKSGERYSRRLIDESERILRGNAYFYDAWIRPVAYHDGQVDLRVTTRDVWTFNPGFNFGRSGGTNSTGVQLEEINFLGSGASVKLEHTTDVDRTKSLVEVSDMHAFGGFTAVDVNYANSSDGRLRDFTLNRPFYALDTRWAGGLSGRDDIQTDSLWDRGQVIDQFRDQHEFVQLYGGWSNGLHNGWVRRFSSGVTYDERRFQPVSTWTGVTAIPQDQRFLYPWVQFGLVEDRYLKFFNHDQIARTEDFYIGTTASVRVGWADSTLGSSRSALMLQSSVGRGTTSSRAATGSSSRRSQPRGAGVSTSTSRSSSAATAGCAAIRCATRTAPHGRSGRSSSASSATGIRFGCSAWARRCSSTWGAPGATPRSRPRASGC